MKLSSEENTKIFVAESYKIEEQQKYVEHVNMGILTEQF